MFTQEMIILSELINVLSEEELIRFAYRLRKAGQLEAAARLDYELKLRAEPQQP